MVQAWFMAENWSGDQREEHHKQPPEYVELDTLYMLTLVEYFKVCIYFLGIIQFSILFIIQK